MPQTLSPIQFTAAEWAYVGALLGLECSATADPFAGMLALEVEEALNEARLSLADRGLLITGSDGTVQPAAALANLLRADLSPQVVVSLVSPEGVHWFALFPGGGLQLCFSADGGQILATPFEDLDEVVTKLPSLVLPGGGTEAPPGTCIHLPEAIYWDARTAGVESARSILEREPIPEPMVEPLSRAVGAPLRTLVILDRRSEPSVVTGMGLLGGEMGLWQVEPVQMGGEHWVTLTPYSLAALECQVQSLLAHPSAAD